MRFNQFHWRIERHINEPMPRGFWQEMRRDFLSLTDVLWLYDEKLSNLVLLACAHNLYFICVQIFHSFHDKGNFMTEIYFWLSIVYVLIRILAMMFAAASIPDAADKITVALYEIPTAYWCSEKYV
ncbi:gustatory receptor for sugar taste 64c-like [Teleopsis dalmanni]|uniref:gustatory receptor for sugar taste 64c-like n=1 Tax=Teleopsis dalmanni TaxID=139649 RepID=UPI0018CE73A8|nr:gustatory receptor for sugar taste 64c-like [Teleopsis dalmanni]